MGVTTEFGELVWGPTRDRACSTYTSYALDDSGDNVGARFILSRSGSITHIGWHMVSKTGTPPNYYVGMVTVQTADGFLTTTPYGGSTPATIDPTALSAGWQWSQLAVAATAVAGAHVGVRIWPTGSPGNPSSTHKIEVAHTHADSAKSSDPTGFYASALGTSTVQIERLPVFAIRYSDGVVFGYPLILPAYSAYNSAGTPDEVGVAFTVPYAMRCIGAHFYIAAVGSNASYTVRMYNAANDLLSSWAVGDEDELEGLGYKTVYWSSPQNLAIGATYRLSVLATHASLTVTPGSGTYPDAYAKAAYFQGADFVATSRTDAGAWTDDADATVFISPIVDQITLPSGSASPRWL